MLLEKAIDNTGYIMYDVDMKQKLAYETKISILMGGRKYEAV